jgi:hypothetical protein
MRRSLGHFRDTSSAKLSTSGSSAGQDSKGASMKRGQPHFANAALSAAFSTAAAGVLPFGVANLPSSLTTVARSELTMGCLSFSVETAATLFGSPTIELLLFLSGHGNALARDRFQLGFNSEPTTPAA